MLINKEAIAVADTITQVAKIYVGMGSALAVEVKNAGAVDLDAFEVRGKVTPNGNEITLASLAGDYTTPNFPLLYASGSPVALVSTASVLLFIDVRVMSEIYLYAKVGAGTTTLDLYGNIKP